jgi:hypothetical protein
MNECRNISGFRSSARLGGTRLLQLARKQMNESRCMCRYRSEMVAHAPG